jgi:hypothetical protein
VGHTVRSLRRFWGVILIQIGLERNESVIEKIALVPDPLRVAQDGLPGQPDLNRLERELYAMKKSTDDL